ncbi:hypothetical protein F5B20DRAFT_550297 [Whalleya microplaca]|nr:hypothetical protein F5B20DRAFT_550297 [Whalleya microplaca]
MSSVPPKTSQQDQRTILCRRRLLSDIKELTEEPYPNITLHTFDYDLSAACLILTPDNYKPLHLTVQFGPNYPLFPPSVRMDSHVVHPNVFGNFICASILRVGDEFTPAYTLKSIAIQFLSFFDSESVEQDYGGKQKLANHRGLDESLIDTFQCKFCHFGTTAGPLNPSRMSGPNSYNALVNSDPEQWPTIQGSITPPSGRLRQSPNSQLEVKPNNSRKPAIETLPNEMLLLVLEQLDAFEDLTNFARAWPRASDIMREFDIVRKRELQCFCLKQNFQSAKLGVGVSVNRGQFSSEFDLLSQEAYTNLQIRQSVNGLTFEHWLPLPISRRHWKLVKHIANISLSEMRSQLKNPGPFDAQVLFAFMNDIVVRLNQVVDDTRNYHSRKSNLHHASEKAIESYFHLFHLLVCLATDDSTLVEKANSLLRSFMDGRQSKTSCPNLGHLLIALLISDIEVTEKLMKDIITEAITRNVVWLFDRGANMPELSYMELDPISAYRLDKTFQGSRTSYRLLMFSELFRRTARPSHQKSLSQVRDELFDRHGAPPRDTAANLAAEVRRIHTINNFPAFLREMGLHNVPTSKNFTAVLRKTVHLSMERGYSKWAISREDALLLRARKDPHLLMTKEMARWVQKHQDDEVDLRYTSFFPKNRRR